MASARVTFETHLVTKWVEVEEQTPGVTLSLTAEEASFLVAILAKIGGDPSGPRGNQESISNALAQAGYSWLDERPTELRAMLSGSMSFPSSKR